MKKIFIGLLILLYLLIVPKVNAQTYTLSINKQQGIYFARTGGNSPYMSSQFAIYKMDDILVYCIETGKHITTRTYKESGNSITLNYNDAVKERLGLIGYYGRDYPGHDTVRYSMATQSLIWEVTSGQKVTFWTKQYEEGSKIDISKEKNEINRLINNHNKLPDIPKDITINYQERKEYHSDLLSEFEILNTTNNVQLEDNKLIIIGKDIGDYIITLQKKRYDDKETLVFRGENSQTMARLRVSKMPSMEIKIHVESPKIRVHKVDDVLNTINLPISFKIKDIINNQYICENDDCTYITQDGYFTTKSLPFGIYEVEEVSEIIPGYAVNQEKKRVEINENSSNIVDITFTNDQVKGVLKLHKQYEKIMDVNGEFNYIFTDLEGIEFDIYDEFNNYVDTIITDSHGYAEYKTLKVGKYYVKEKNIGNNYYLDDRDTFFEIKQNNPFDTVIYQNLEIRNYLKKGQVTLKKVDDKTFLGIPKTRIGLYNDRDELLITKETNQEGVVEFKNIPLGKYYLKEIKANYYYANTDEKVFFEIKENNDCLYHELKNNLILGNLEIVKYGEKVIYQDNQIIYEKISLPNIEFLLYDEKDNLIDTLITDHNGYTTYQGLKLGKYYLVEKTKLDNYQDNPNKIYFEIKKDNDKALDVHLEINNYLKKGILEFTKKDAITSQGISNTLIEIYNDKDEVIYSGKTDEKGVITLRNLLVGNYYLLEKEANKMYQITNEKVCFEILDGQITQAEMTNERKVITVPKTDKDDTYINAFFSFSLLCSLIGVFYEQKKAC